MNSAPLLRFILAGQLRREYIITPDGKAYLDIPGGNLLYAAAGLGIWEKDVGLIARAGENYPHEWLSQISRRGFDVRGVRVLPQTLEHRSFIAYTDFETRHTDNPVSHFARLQISFPKSLLGYTGDAPQLDSRTQPALHTIRLNDFPPDYLDATAAHLCPMDFISHSLLPSVLRQGHVNTITLDPPAGYMNPTFWDNVPSILRDVTAFLCSEEKICHLFQGRSTDLWEMAEALASQGCELVVIKRGSRGQYLYEHANHSRWIIPAYPARVSNPTGAGDAFCGGFLAGFRSTYSPLQAALHGNISSSLVIEGTGAFYALGALPTLAQARLEALQNMARRV